jgi:hypothetical protein
MSYKTQGTPSISQLTDTVISNPQNRDVLQYNSSTGVWDNGTLDLSGQDINLDEIDCRVLRVSETADVEGRLANKGVASFVNDEFIFQNGISNLGDTIYIDNVNTRVGIGISNPEEDLEVDGSIQIDSANVARLKFQQTGMNPHALSEIDGEQDGVDGGDLRFFTKRDTGSLTEKLRINNVGAVGIAGANYGTSGQVLTSAGSGAVPTWTTPAGGGITQYATFTYQPAVGAEQLITNTFTRLEYDIVSTAGGSNITLDTTTNIGRITLATIGVYMINYYSSSYIFTGSTRVITESALYVNPNTGTFIQEDATRSFCYLRQSADPENTAGISYLLTVSASNTEVELQFRTADTANLARMKRKACGITIVKIA